MTYADLDAVFAAVPQRFAPKEKYVPRLLTRVELAAMEERVGESLPEKVVQLYTRYDFTALEFGELSFGAAKTSLETQNDSRQYQMPWWEMNWERPVGTLCFGLDGQGMLLLDCRDGSVSYFHALDRRLIPVNPDLGDFILCSANLFWHYPDPLNVATVRPLVRYLDEGREYWALQGIEL